MPSRFRLRVIFKPLVQRLAKGLARLGCTPNQVTALTLALSAASLALFFIVPLSWPIMAVYALIIFFTGVMDGVDGAIARATGKKTRWGGVFDSTLDRYSDALIFFTPAVRELFRGDIVSSSWLGLPVVNLVPLWAWSLLLVIGSYMTSYVRARTTVADPSADVDVGMFGRSERLFTIVVAAALNLLPIVIVALAVVTNIMAIFRVVDARKRLPVENE